MGNSLEQALKRCDFLGGACAPLFLRRRAPLDALKRLIGFLKNTVNQASLVIYPIYLA